MKQRRLGDDLNLRVTVLMRLTRDHATTKMVRHELQAVANPECRQACSKNLRISLRRRVVVDARGSSRQDDALGLQLQHALQRRCARKHYRKHIELANSASD